MAVTIMLTQQRREKEKEQRRNLILDAAQTLFFSKNYSEITIEEIADKAQLAKGTLYTYFKSKEALYSAVALRGAHIMNEMFKDAADRNQSGLEKAFAIGQAYYEFYKRHPHYFHVLVEAENLPVARSDDINAAELIRVSCENLETVLNAVVTGIKDGSIKPDLNPQQTSIFLIQSTRAMILLPPGFEIFLRRADADRDATVKFTLRALRGSIENIQTKKIGD
ncbi:MAG: TetR/AcrR family transcriptional regulator [Candidatus Bathyarchaeia archaeon]|jgi:AcrR family transcriptional regulator